MTSWYLYEPPLSFTDKDFAKRSYCPSAPLFPEPLHADGPRGVLTVLQMYAVRDPTEHLSKEIEGTVHDILIGKNVIDMMWTRANLAIGIEHGLYVREVQSA